MTAADALTAAYEPACALAARIAGNAEDGDDLVQEAMLRLWAARERYEADELPRMLFRTMVNIQRDRHRRAVRIRMNPMPESWTGRPAWADWDGGMLVRLPVALIDDESPEALAVAACEQAEREVACARVRELLGSMTEIDRNALLDAHVEGVCQRSRGPRFRSQVFRARLRFRQAWEAAA